MWPLRDHQADNCYAGRPLQQRIRPYEAGQLLQRQVRPTRHKTYDGPISLVEKYGRIGADSMSAQTRKGRALPND